MFFCKDFAQILIKVISNYYRINFEKVANKFVFFRFNNVKIIVKCELNAYLFLRYFCLLFVIFVSFALFIFSILLSVNFVNNNSSKSNIISLDRLF